MKSLRELSFETLVSYHTLYEFVPLPQGVSSFEIKGDAAAEKRHLMKKILGLEKVTLSSLQCDVEYVSFIPESVTCVVLENCVLSADSFSSICSCLPNLTTLWVWLQRASGGDLLKNRTPFASSSLRSLSLSSVSCTSASLQVVLDDRVLQSLSDLALLAMDTLTDAAISHICSRNAAFPSLQALSLDGCSRLTDASVRALGSHAVLRSSMKFLSLGRIPRITDAAVTELVSASFLRLRQLHLPSHLASPSYAAALQSLKKLRKFSVLFSSSFEDDSLLVEGENLCLQSLSVLGCTHVTDAGLRHVIARAPHLKSLNCSRCPLVSDATVETLAANCPLLTELSAFECVRLTSLSLTHLSQHCHNLSTLLVAGCRRVKADGILAILRACPLRVLDISDCQVSDATMVEPLSQADASWLSLPHLQRLVAVDCKLLDAPFAEVCITKFPELGYMNFEVAADNVILAQNADLAARQARLAQVKARLVKCILRV